MNKERQYVKNNSMPGIYLAPGTDLNNLCGTSAVYYIVNNSEGANIVNNPVGGNRFWMQVWYMAPGKCTQIVFPVRTGLSAYMRVLEPVNDVPTWSDWMPFMESALGKRITASSGTHGDLNKYNSAGVYFVNSSSDVANIDNKPAGYSSGVFRLQVEYVNNANRCIQQLIPLTGDKIYQRTGNTSGGSTTWTSWFVFTGTEVT